MKLEPEGCDQQYINVVVLRVNNCMKGFGWIKYETNYIFYPAEQIRKKKGIRDC